MSVKRLKSEYDMLLESGELLLMFPELSGKWSKDKAEFKKLWDVNQQAINDIDISIDEE